MFNARLSPNWHMACVSASALPELLHVAFLQHLVLMQLLSLGPLPAMLHSPSFWQFQHFHFLVATEGLCVDFWLRATA